MHALTIAGLALYGAVVWRLRGGAFETLSGINLGTVATRAITGLLMAAPLAILSTPWALCFAPAVFLGLSAVGWGPFMAMDGGRATDGTDGSSPYRWIVESVMGIRVGVGYVWHDIAGMLVVGVVMTLTFDFPLVLCAWFGGPSRGASEIILIASGLTLAPIYWACSRAQKWLPYEARVFNTFQTYAEFLVGAVMQVALYLAAAVLT